MPNPFWYFFWFDLGTPPVTAPVRMQNRAGIARAGAVRAGSYTPNFVVTIDGVNRTDDILPGLSLSLSINDEPDTARFMLMPETTIPEPNQIVEVALGAAGNPLFGGQVDVVTHERLPGHVATVVSVECVDWLRLFDRRRVTERYTGVSATAILRDLVQRYSSGFSAKAIENGLPIIDDIQFTDDPLSACFRKVTGQIGGGFYVSGRRLVHAWGNGPETGPHAPSRPATLANTLGSLVWFRHQKHASQKRNRVIVVGAGSRTVFDAAAGDTTLPIEESTYFSATGGSALVGQNVISYTGIGSRYVQSRDWKTQLSPESNRWRAIAWSPTYSIFAALAFNGTTRAMCSTDGTTWVMGVQPQSNGYVSVIWASGLVRFVGLSFDGTFRVTTSVGGRYWEGIAASEQNAWSDLVWANWLTLLVAVAVDGTHRVMTSPDAFTWTNRTAAVANQWVSVACSESLHLIVAIAADAPSGSDAIMTSPDGFTWTSRTLAFANWSVVVRSEELGLFVAVNSDETNSMAAYSTDGQTWLTVAIPAGAWIGLTWIAELGLFEACSEKSTEPARIITSPDGKTWSTDFTDEVEGDGAAIAWSPELGIIVVGTDDERHPVLTNQPIKYPTLTGIPVGGEGSIQTAVPLGTDVHIRAQVDDVAAQAALAAIEGGDGVHVHIVRDDRYSIDGATARAAAEVSAFAEDLMQAEYDSEDMNARPGAAQVISLTGAENVNATLTILRVEVTFPYHHALPQRRVTAGTVVLAGSQDVVLTDQG